MDYPLNIKNRHLTNYLLLALGIASAVWFFLTYSSQDPRSAAKVSFTKEQIRSKAVKKLSDLGYSNDNFVISKVRFQKNDLLIDSLQRELGRPQFIHWEQQNKTSNIKPFYWSVNFRLKGSSKSFGEFFSNPESESLQLYFDERGNFLALLNPFKKYPKRKVQRNALTSIFKASPDTVTKPLFAEISDSTLRHSLFFNLHIRHSQSFEHSRIPEKMALKNFKRNRFPLLLSVNRARSLANYYINETGWDKSTLSFDTAFVQRINNMKVANVQYLSNSQRTGQQLQLNVTVAPTGALMNMGINYFPGQPQKNVSNYIWLMAKNILIGLLALAGLIIFIFRIQSGAVDIPSSLIFAVIMGVVFLLSYFLRIADAFNLFAGSYHFHESIPLYLVLVGVVVSAFVAIGFFMLFAVADSLTRQYWPHKLTTYDYLRRKQVFNKPIGRMIVRAAWLSFILCGVWMILLYIFPHASLSASIGDNSIFLQSNSVWPSLGLLLSNGLVCTAFVAGVFLVIGGLVIGKTKRYWLTAIIIFLLCGILMPMYMTAGPTSTRFLFGLSIGAVFTFIYFRWDFITLLLTQFLFLGWIGSASGWLTSNSPDTNVFIVFAAITFVLLLIGYYGVFRGEEQPSRGEFEPEYVEELAQEQRIKQELQIARKVQQSFLPVKIPNLQNLDIAAVCLPANETGGDYYDIIPLDNHRVAVAIGDVSGKGIEAAFYMTLVKGMLHALCRETSSPVEIMSKINRLFYENSTKQTFISLVFGVIDLETQTFTLARAGHNPIIHVQSSTGNVEVLQPDGMGLGLTKKKIFDNKIREIKLSITKDDLFVLYTDGIVEALNQAHQFYGTQNLIKLIKEQKDNSASKTIAEVTNSVNRFIGSAKRHDDMTLMAIRLLVESE